MVPQPDSIFPAHSFGSPAEFWNLAGVIDRLKKVLNWAEGIDVIKIGIDKDKITICVFNFFDLAVIIGM